MHFRICKKNIIEHLSFSLIISNSSGLNVVVHFKTFSVVGGKCCKTDKVVKREICSIQTKGTKRLSFIDGDSTDCASQFLLALCEKVGLLLTQIVLLLG